MSNRVYRVEKDIFIPWNHRLFIQPGAELRFAPNTSLIVHGQLVARGKPESPITFTAADPVDATCEFTCTGDGAEPCVDDSDCPCAADRWGRDPAA